MIPKLVCLDVDGTLTDGLLGPPLPGVRRALERLRAACAVRLVTNATSVTHARLFAKLREQGLADEPSALVTPLTQARAILPSRGHARGVLVAEPETRSELGWFVEDPAAPVVLLAGEVQSLRIEELQPAFRRLVAGAAFYTVQRNRYFRRGGALVTDAGPLVAFFEYAAGARAEVLGKPSRLLYETLARGAGAALSEVVMAGDDAEFDASAAVALGMRGVLVRTGKYRAGDESRHAPAPTATLASVADLPDRLGIL